MSRRRFRRALDNLADHCADEIVMAAERGRREGRAETAAGDADAHRDWEAEAKSLRFAIITHRARNHDPVGIDDDLYAHLGESDSLPQHGSKPPPRGYSSGTTTQVSEWRSPKGADGDH